MTDDIAISRDGAVLILAFNRPLKKNAITTAMYGALADAINAGEVDPAVRAILIQGSSGVFTAGNDLSDFAAVNAGGGASRQTNRFITSLGGAKKPVVAAVEGFAVGIGVTLLLHCDLVYVAEDAKLSTPFVNLAVVPEFASSLLLPARIGHARAFAMFALGETVLGKDAAAIGLANAALPAGEVQAKALAAAQALATRPAGALRITKSLMREMEAITHRIEVEGAHFGERLKSKEAAEAFRAFAERRAPDFTGFEEG